MKSFKSPGAVKGSRRWAAYVAEMVGWGAAAVAFLVVHLAGLSGTDYVVGLALTAMLAAWVGVFFRAVLPAKGDDQLVLGASLAVAFALCAGLYSLLRPEMPSAQILFLPVVLLAGLLATHSGALIAAAASAVAVWAIAAGLGHPVTPVSWLLDSALLVLAGVVAGLLARELRTHYRAEQQEHRLATAVRHRLLAVLDAVDEAIVFSDRTGTVRAINSRTAELFDIDPNSFLSGPVVQLQRTIARATEDPEEFMETFQQLRDDPQLELRGEIDQLIPERRRLRMHSAPTRDETGALVGRIDVYADITESIQRAAEIQSLYEEARKTAESFQRGLLPETVPRLPRFSLVAHYVPAAGNKAVCGDFYDFISLPDGRVAIVLGDVCGLGPTAANDAALTRYTLRSVSDDEERPEVLIEELNDHLLRHLSSERFVRLLYSVVDPERAVIEYVNAGHVPPALYRCRTGDVEWLGEGGIALGIEEEARYKVARVELEPGDTVVFFTDGVTEAPRLGQPFGQGRFLDLVREYGVGTPGELIQAIRRGVEAWSSGLRDDLAMVVCQVAPDTTIGEPLRELVLPNEAARISEVRNFVAAFLADLRAPVDESTELLIAAGEAAANACRHGRKDEGRSEIRVRCSLEGSAVAVTIADDGPGFDPALLQEQSLPDRFAAGGRGLFLMRQLCDEVRVDSGPEGSAVTLVRVLFAEPMKLPDPPPAEPMRLPDPPPAEPLRLPHPPPAEPGTDL